jgi:hypothetical protein
VGPAAAFGTGEPGRLVSTGFWWCGAVAAV